MIINFIKGNITALPCVFFLFIFTGCSHHGIEKIIGNTQVRAQEEYIRQVKEDLKRYELAKQNGVVGKAIDSILHTTVLSETDTVFLIENCNPPMYQYQYYAFLLINEKEWTIYWDGKVQNNNTPRNASETKMKELVRRFNYNEICRLEHERPLAYHGAETRYQIITRFVFRNGHFVNVQSYIMHDIRLEGETSPVIFD